MNVMRKSLLAALIAVLSAAVAISQQAPPAGRQGGAPGPVFWVSSPAWPDGGEIPMRNAGRGENKSPAFEFHWNLGTNPGAAPDTLETYAVILHDLQNSTNKTSVDTLHWSAFNIPGTAKGLPEGLGSGDLPDGTRNGPGIRPGSYFGPAPPAGPSHHYVFEFYALDTKLDLPANTTRDALLKAMEGHVIGKAAWFGRIPVPGQ